MDDNAQLLVKAGLVKSEDVSVKFQVFHWGNVDEENELPHSSRFDAIVMADVIYNPEALDLLEASLNRLAGLETMVYISQRRRFKVIEEHFFQHLERQFDIEVVKNVKPQHYEESIKVTLYRLRRRCTTAKVL